MNIQLNKLINETNLTIEELRKDRENCETKEGWDAISEIIIEKRGLVAYLTNCL